MIAAARAIDITNTNVGAQAALAQTQPQPQTPPPAASSGASQPDSVGPWKKDLSYFAGNMQSGIPGLQREIHDTVWNVEHLQNKGVASELLRSIVLVSLAYVGIGSAIKYQSMG